MLATRFKVWGWGGAVGQGAMASVRVGVAGVAKKANAGLPYVVASELLCANLARHILLPVPPSFVIQNDDGIPYHVSLNFALAGENLPPADAPAIAAALPSLAWGTVIFDIWVGNSDRHNGNLAFDSAKSALMLFDHSHAFIGGANVNAWLVGNAGQLGIGGHCLAPLVSDVQLISSWIERINAIPEFYIRGLLEECVTVGLPDAEVNGCLQHLLTRRQHLLALIKAHPANFPAVPANQWNNI